MLVLFRAFMPALFPGEVCVLCVKRTICLANSAWCQQVGTCASNTTPRILALPVRIAATADEVCCCEGMLLIRTWMLARTRLL